jgi:hypothetical protein
MIHELSAGIPLIIQIIAFLIIEGEQALIDSLGAEKHPVAVLLARYGEVLAGEAVRVRDISLDDVRSVMRLLSAVGPIDIRTADFREKAAEFLACDVTRLANVISSLEMTGILVQAGSKSSIVPDLLRPFILREALGSGSLHTDFAERLLATFGYDKRILLSLATVDRMQGSEGIGLDQIWGRLKKEIRTAFPLERVQILDQVSDLGYVLPKEALRIVEIVIYNPTEPDPKQALRGLHEFTHSDALNKLAPMLRAIAASGSEYVRRCVQLLWCLGRDEEKRFSGESAFDTLVEMARYGRYKSLLVNLEVLSEIEAISARPEEQQYRHLPIDIVEPVLGKTFTNMENRGATLTISELPVAAANVLSVRKKALDILSAALSGNSLRTSTKAVQYLARCLDPVAVRNPESDLIWGEEQRRVLSLLEIARDDDARPILHAKIAATLSWHAQLNPDNLVRERCAGMISGLEGTEIFDWYASLIPDVARHLPSLAVGVNFDELQTAIDSLLTRVANRALTQRPTVLVDAIARSLREIEQAGMSGSAAWIFVTLTNADFAYAKESAEVVVADFGAHLGEAISPVLHRGWVDEPDWADTIIARIFSAREQGLYMAVAHALWMHSAPSESASADAARRSAVIARLIELGDASVRAVALRAVATLMSIDKRAGIELILSISRPRNWGQADSHGF